VPGVGGSVLIRRILGSLARDVRARPLLRLLELGAMASSSALARAAVCLNASRILAGRDRGDERQNHNDDPGHRCRLRARRQIPGDSSARAALWDSDCRRRGCLVIWHLAFPLLRSRSALRKSAAMLSKPTRSAHLRTSAMISGAVLVAGSLLRAM
jgi:hypothetical protein